MARGWREEDCATPLNAFGDLVGAFSSQSTIVTGESSGVEDREERGREVSVYPRRTSAHIRS